MSAPLSLTDWDELATLCEGEVARYQAWLDSRILQKHSPVDIEHATREHRRFTSLAEAVRAQRNMNAERFGEVA